MKKNIVLPEKNKETTIIASGFDDERGQFSTSTRIWQWYGYFNQQPSGLNLKERNYSENGIIYINQSYLTIKIAKRCSMETTLYSVK